MNCIHSDAVILSFEMHSTIEVRGQIHYSLKNNIHTLKLNIENKNYRKYRINSKF